MQGRKKLLIIGVDAGSPELFRKWCASGDLPNVSRLLEQGQQRSVTNPYGLEAGTVWPVFHSGRMPGRQPQYDGRRFFVPEDYSVRWYEPEETPPTIWRQLSDQGIRCLLIDPPYTPLDTDIRGNMVVDWGSHVPADGRRFHFRTHPADLADEVLDLVGPDPAGGVICDRRAPESIEEHRRFRDIQLQRIDSKGRMAAHLLAQKPWDLALVVSSDLHCAGHHLWHVNDPLHPRHTSRLQDALGEPLRECYRAFDRSVGAMLDAVGPDTTVMLFGSHGMGPAFSGTGLLDRILWRLDKGVPQGSQRPLKGRLRALWHSVPLDVRGLLKPLRRHVKGVLRQPQFFGGHEDRRYFEVYANNASGGEHLNIRGREGRGIVDPADVDSLLEELTRELKRVVNVDTGEPLADDVICSRDQYDGPYADRLPDILVRWNRNAPIRAVRSERIGELAHDFEDNRSGDHTPDGICVVVGPGIEPEAETPVRTVDIAPTIAEFFELELMDYDGKPFALAQLAEAT